MKRKLKVALFLATSFVTFASYAVWQMAHTVVYYSDASKTEVVGYEMRYCQIHVPELYGTTSQFTETLYGGSCSGGGAVPPIP